MTKEIMTNNYCAQNYSTGRHNNYNNVCLAMVKTTSANDYCKNSVITAKILYFQAKNIILILSHSSIRKDCEINKKTGNQNR